LTAASSPKPITTCGSVLPPEIVMHDDAYIGGHSENNIKCVVHDELGRKNQATRYILPHHWLYDWFSQFHSCETYSVLSRSPSIVFKLNTLGNWHATYILHTLLSLNSAVVGTSK